MAENFLMKDGLGPDAVERISRALKAAHPDFQRGAFENQVLHSLNDLELKDRVRHIISVLGKTLPADFRETSEILWRMPEVFDPGNPTDNLRGFAAWPLIDYVGAFGLDQPDVALPLLKRLTPMFSSEFAIRSFIRQHPERTLAALQEWTADPDPHVRRLVSEGTRPRLPWGERLHEFVDDPRPILPLLEALKDDPSDYVRRSVANNLNDIAKDHPDLVIEICRKWSEDASSAGLSLIRRALRTLVKRGHPEVYPLLGYTAEPKLNVRRLDIINDHVSLGQDLAFQVELTSKAPEQRFVVDFAIHFVKANGTKSPKIFKLRNVEVGKGETVILEKTLGLKPITTRKYYSGEHLLAVHVNGREIARAAFHLEV